mmetsp:Transcript_5271/g.16574  ORF Transcript_5271/g.16574 Transcript_5271/m.16574 type:complete len:492 (+) Transcript_5271:697-2172(+)
MEIANTTWAFAITKFDKKPLFDAIADEVLDRLHYFNPMDLSTTAWAFATVSAKGVNRYERLFEVMALEVQRKIHAFNSQDLANAAWAFSTVGVAPPRLFYLIARRATSRIDDFACKGIAIVVWAFPKAGLASSPLFDAVASNFSTQRRRRLNEQDIANTAWALATTLRREMTEGPIRDFFAAIDGEAIRLVDGFGSQALANTIWAFACVSWPQSRIFAVFGSALARRVRDLDVTLRSMLYVVALYVRIQWGAEYFDNDFPLSTFAKSLRSAYTRCKPRPSLSQRKVAAVLDQMGWAHAFEYETDDGMSLDLAQPDLKRAIEVDGPSHYLEDVTTGERFVNGATRFKSRLLQRLGWNVVHVPFEEWNDKSDVQRRRLLTDKLATFLDDDGDAKPRSLSTSPPPRDRPPERSHCAVDHRRREDDSSGTLACFSATDDKPLSEAAADLEATPTPSARRRSLRPQTALKASDRPAHPTNSERARCLAQSMKATQQ